MIEHFPLDHIIIRIYVLKGTKLLLSPNLKINNIYGIGALIGDHQDRVLFDA